jgi:hypothetical protein
MATGTAPAPDDGPQPPTGRFADDLIGLDPEDPETQAFAAHLDRIQHSQPSYTVEGYLRDLGRFSDSANRLGGHRLMMARLLVALILIPVAFGVWEAVKLLAHLIGF